MKKRIFASLLAICMLGTSVFAAEEVIFTESFEIEPDDGFYVSTPEIRAYSSNLLADSNGVYQDGTFDADANDTEGLSGTNYNSTHFARSGNRSWRIGISNQTTYSATFGVPAKDLKAGDIIEIEAYVRTRDSADVAYGVMISPSTANNTKAYYTNKGFSNFGNKTDIIVTSLAWQKVSAQFSIDKDAVGTHGSTTLTDTSRITFLIKADTARGTVYDKPIYIDDIKIRKIENAVAQSSGANIGMPTFPIDKIEGKSNVQVVMDAKNTGNKTKNITLITACYNEDGSLNDVLDVTTETVANDSAVHQIATNNFTVPDTDGKGAIKTYVWDGIGTLVPYTDSVDSKDVLNHERPASTVEEAYALWGKALPSTDRLAHPVYVRDNLASNSAGLTTTPFTYSVESGTAKTGLRALLIPAATGLSNDTASAAGITFAVEPGTTYKLKAYVSQTANYCASVQVGGATQPGVIRGYAKTLAGTWSSTDTKFGVSGNTALEKTVEAIAPDGINNSKFLTLHTKQTGGNQWAEITFTFTTPAADAKAIDYFAEIDDSVAPGENDLYWDFYGNHISIMFGPSNYTVTGGSSTGACAWVDDITLIKVTE